jgi:hypothetical protein
MVTALFGVDASDEDEDESCSEDDESNTTLLFRFLFLFLVGVGCPGPIVRMFCKKVCRKLAVVRVEPEFLITVTQKLHCTLRHNHGSRLLQC